MYATLTQQTSDRKTNRARWAGAGHYVFPYKKRAYTNYTILGYTQATKIAANGKKKKEFSPLRKRRRKRRDPFQSDAVFVHPWRCLCTRYAMASLLSLQQLLNLILPFALPLHWSILLRRMCIHNNIVFQKRFYVANFFLFLFDFLWLFSYSPSFLQTLERIKLAYFNCQLFGRLWSLGESWMTNCAVSKGSSSDSLLCDVVDTLERPMPFYQFFYVRIYSPVTLQDPNIFSKQLTSSESCECRKYRSPVREKRIDYSCGLWRIFHVQRLFILSSSIQLLRAASGSHSIPLS